MADYASKRIDEMECLPRGAMRKVRAELGLTSFGVQTIDLFLIVGGVPGQAFAAGESTELGKP